MPITGRPSKRCSGSPWFFIHERCANPSLSALPNHPALRSLGFCSAIVSSCGFFPSPLAGEGGAHRVSDGRVRGLSRESPGGSLLTLPRFARGPPSPARGEGD